MTAPTKSPVGGELLPCPFCGGEAERIDIEDGENAGGSCISCTSCQASSNVEFEFKENFISNWNRRAAPPPPTPDGGWLPIESAPKDGTEVDLWLAPISEEGINLTPCRVPNAHLHCGDWLVWSTTDECEPCWIAIKHRITHWQPLPSPPVTEGT